MKAIKIISVLYIGIVSVIVLIFSIIGIIETGFELINFSALIEILLSLFGVIILVLSLFKGFGINSFLLLLWWTPQLISILIKTFDSTNILQATNVLYQVKILFSVSYGWGWILSANRYLTINFNLIAIAALLLIVFLIKEKAPTEQEA
jgi:hypothetical protein